MGTKVSDRFCVPGCNGHHARQHQIGWKAFEEECRMVQGGSLLFAHGYWRNWPGRKAWEAKQ